MNGGILDLFSSAVSRFPDLGEVYLWAASVPVLVVLFFFARLVIRSLVNKRVHSIETFTSGLLDLDSMRRKGMISEEEYKTMRKRVAERQLQQLNEQTASRNTMQVLTAIERNPSLAGKLLPEVAQAAGTRGAGENRELPSTPPSPEAPLLRKPPPSRADVLPGDPLSDPRFVEQAAPPRGGHRRKRPPLDLDSMLAKGLISKEEYERLLSLQEKL
jgi:uncharacterized membrane protein